MLSSLCVLKVRRSDSENENRLFFFILAVMKKIMKITSQ